MKKSTLCFCLRDNQVLLAMKKRGFGERKWNGYGGKVHEGEPIVTAAIREVYEESSLLVRERDLVLAAVVRFFFNETPVSECSVYLTHAWKGEPLETEEMRPQWYSVDALPFDSMWAADVRWIPLILKGETIRAEVRFNADGSEVKEFTSTSAVF